MKKNTLLIVFSFFSMIVLAQTASEITLVKTFGGAKFEMDTLTLSPRQVLEILRETPLAYEEFKLAKKNYNIAGVMGFSGAILVGVPVISAISGGDPEWGLVAGGAALILGSIPLNKVFQKRANNALDVYNKKFSSRIKTNFFLTGTGFRLYLRF